MKRVLGLFLLVSSAYAEDLDEIVRNLNGRVEELAHKVESLEKKMNDFSSRASEQEDSSEEQKSISADLKKKPSELIKTAKNYIRHDKNESARDILKAFIKENPKDIYCGMMQYYVGKSYFAEKDYQKAADAYMESFGTNPNGAKTPKALYRLAECFEKLGKNEQSRTTLEKIMDSYSGTKYAKKSAKRIVESYPDTEYAKKAAKLLK